MQIELYINGEKKVFTAPFVPMLAKRKFLEIQAAAEERKEPLSVKEQLEEDDAVLSILSDIVFNKQFTIEELYKGASKEYIDAKLFEAIYGVKPDEVKKEDGQGNDKGK